MGFADRVIFILGLTLAGVILFVFIAGLIIAVLKIFMSSNKSSVQIMTNLDHSPTKVPAVPTSSKDLTLLDNKQIDNASS